jgi:hypothetical protein
VTVELTLLSRVAYRGQEVTGPRPRGLLALLAGDLRRGCGTARLVEGLWPDEQPEHPAKALQVVVSRARAQLGADLIASTPTGYRLTLTEDQVDASAVLLRAAASAQRARAGDHAATAGTRMRAAGFTPVSARFQGSGIRVKVMSIQGCQVAPSSLRSHLAVMPVPSAPTVRVDRTAPRGSAAVGWAAAATSAPPVNRHTPSSSTLARMTVTRPSLSKARAVNESVPGSCSPMISIAWTGWSPTMTSTWWTRKKPPASHS